MKIVSSLLIATWLLCWVHCFAEKSSFAGNDGCCGSSITENQSKADARYVTDHDAADFDCVQEIFAKGISLAEKLAVMPVVHIELPAAYFLALYDPTEKSDELVADIPRPPPICFRSWEFIVRASHPVRGPTLIA